MKTRGWMMGAVGLSLMASTAPAHALSSLIVIPTARTTGDHRYSQAVTYEDVVFGVGEQRWVLKTRFGLGPRGEVGLNLDPNLKSDTPALWQAKYTFASTNDNRSVAAIGFRSLGINTKWSPYIVATQNLGNVEAHAGLTETRSALRYFLGADGRIADDWRWMADFTSGAREFWSVGVDHRIDNRWSVRAGYVHRNDDEVSRASIEVKYGSTY